MEKAFRRLGLFFMSLVVVLVTWNRLPQQTRGSKCYSVRAILDCAGRASAATALSKRSGGFDWFRSATSSPHTLESGIALRFPPQSKIPAKIPGHLTSG